MGISGAHRPSSAYRLGANDGPTGFGVPFSALSVARQGGLLGKAIMCNFSPPARSPKNGPGPGTLPGLGWTCWPWGTEALQGTGCCVLSLLSFCKESQYLELGVLLSVLSDLGFTHWSLPWVALTCLLILAPQPGHPMKQCHTSQLSLWQSLPPISELFWDFIEHWLASPALTSVSLTSVGLTIPGSAVSSTILPSINTIFIYFDSRKQVLGLFSKIQAVITIVTYQQKVSGTLWALKYVL